MCSIFMYTCMYALIYTHALCMYVLYVCRAMLDAAHYLLRPLILRRVKSEVETLLPPKLETLIHCPMSDMQVGMYVCVYVASLSIFVVGLVCMYVCMYVCM